MKRNIISKRSVNRQVLKEYPVDRNQRLIDFLIAAFPQKSRNNVKSLLARKLVLVDGAPVSQFDFELVKGDIVQISPVSVSKTKQRASRLKILFENEDYIVISKPAGLLSVATDKEKTITAYRLVMDYVRSADPRGRIFVTHRIDKETSGVLLFTKNESLRNGLQERWNELVEERQYTALVEGTMEKEEDTIVSYLRETSTNLVYSAHKKGDGQRAVTHYKVKKSNGKYSLLDIHIDSGRKNQIRVHMKESGHPVVGDDKYLSTCDPLKRLGLHARKLVLKDPRSGERMSFVAPDPDFSKVFRPDFKEPKQQEKKEIRKEKKKR